MGRVYNNPATGLIAVEDTDGHIVWNTERAPVNLLPESAWIVLDDYQISFPDLQKRWAYGYGRWDSPLGNVQYNACETWVTLAPGEWGPGRQHNISGIVLGTVPAGCNYIDVRVRMSRTKDPTNFVGLPVPSLLPPQETLLQGGSCLVESCGGWRRLFEIVLQGQNIVLNRYQSTHSEAFSGGWVTGNLTGGWSNGGGSGSDTARFAARIEQKASVAVSSWQHARNGSDQCSRNVNSVDFSSTYTGTITIRPGYIAP